MVAPLTPVERSWPSSKRRGTKGGTRKPEIFISYRHDDTGDTTPRVADRLTREFGDGVFFDRDGHSIKVFESFGEVIDARVAAADVVLAMIGADWADRLGEPTDYVARELRGAMAAERLILPVLVDRLEPPRPAEIPSDLLAILDRQAPRLVRTADMLESDVDTLVKALRPLVHDDRSRVRKWFDRDRRWIVPTMQLLAVAVLATVMIVMWPRDEAHPTMDGSFNVAVTDFATTDLPEIVDEEQVGTRVAAAVSNVIESTAVSIEGLLVWGAGQAGSIQAEDAEARRSMAVEKASELRSDVLIYGTVGSGSSGSSSIELGIVILSESRRPTDPLVLERAFGLVGEVDDITRLRTGSEALRALPELRFLAPLLHSVYLLDRDDAAAAVSVLQQTRSDVEATGGVARRSDQLLAVIDGMLGVAFSRQAEVDPSRFLQLGMDAFARALAIDPQFTFAEVGLLGLEYLDVAGSPGNPEQASLLEDLRRRYVALRDRDGDVSSVTWAQSTNVIGQIDLLLYEAGGSVDLRRRADAVESFTAVDRAYVEAQDVSPELAILANVARADLGYAAATAGDYDDALQWYGKARDIATPYWRAVQTGNIGRIELLMGRSCDARASLERALDAQGDAGYHVTQSMRSALEAELIEARALCPSG